MPLPQWLNVLDTLGALVGAEADTPEQSRRALLGRSVGLIAGLAGAWSLSSPGTAAASDRPGRPSRRRRKREDAWFSARSVLAFPLATYELPRTGGQLAESMLAGWKDVFTLRDPRRAIWFEGGRYPAIDKMTIDISGAVAKTGKPGASKAKQPDLRPFIPGKLRSLAVKEFIFQAAPIYHYKAQVNFYVAGTDVRFDLRQDTTGRPLLLLSDAKAGSLHFRSTCGDLERLLIAGAKPKAAEHAVNLRDVDIHLNSETPRSVKLDMKVRTLIAGFLPAGLRFRARVDVDDRMNAHIWGLSCDGDEALGPLIVNFIRPGLAKYEGKTRPLLSFPTGSMRLHDLRIRAGETVELAAAFGR
jgi:hypothetical protein